jgi:hypothetical protein
MKNVRKEYFLTYIKTNTIKGIMIIKKYFGSFLSITFKIEKVPIIKIRNEPMVAELEMHKKRKNIFEAKRSTCFSRRFSNNGKVIEIKQMKK